jgi:hypothetical protein
VARVQEELVSAVKQGDEALARKLVFQLGAGPRQVRAVLETMLEEPASLVRQAAVFESYWGPSRPIAPSEPRYS